MTNQTGVVNVPATGAPAITAVGSAFRVPAVLRVDLSGIADANGVRGIRSSVTYEWERLLHDGTIDVANIGTGSTYTLTEADAGKRVRVWVRFTDDQQFEEGRLGSGVSPIITIAPTDPVDPHYVYKSEQSPETETLASSPETPPRMPSRSRVQYSETPRDAEASGVLSDEYGYDQRGYYRRIVHSDGRVTCHFNGYDGSLADIACND